jgi:hypothetical protein
MVKRFLSTFYPKAGTQYSIRFDRSVDFITLPHDKASSLRTVSALWNNNPGSGQLTFSIRGGSSVLSKAVGC